MSEDKLDGGVSAIGGGAFGVVAVAIAQRYPYGMVGTKAPAQ